MGQSDGETSTIERIRRRHQLAVNAEAALAVQHLAGLQAALGGRHHVADEPLRRAHGLAQQTGAGDGDAQLQADQVIGPVKGRVAAGVVGNQSVFGETALHIVRRRLEGDVHPPAQVPGDRLAVALDAGHHLDRALVVQRAAVIPWTAHLRQFVGAGGRKGEAVRGGRQPSGVGHGRHLDRRFGSIEERVEHFRVEGAGLRVPGRESVVLPHRVRGRGMIGGQVFGPLAGADHLESARPGPVNLLADERRLVAVGQGVDDPRLGRAPGQQRSGQNVPFHVDHDHVTAPSDGQKGMADAALGHAGGFHHHLHAAGGDQRLGVFGDMGGPLGQGLGEGGRADPFLGPAGRTEGRPRRGDGKVRHPENVQPGRVQGLGQEHGTELSGPDEADAQRPALLGPGQEHAMESHGFFRAPRCAAPGLCRGGTAIPDCSKWRRLRE